MHSNDECDAFIAALKPDDASVESDKEGPVIPSLNHKIDEYTAEQLDGIVRNVIECIKKAFKSNEQEVMISYRSSLTAKKKHGRLEREEGGGGG